MIDPKAPPGGAARDVRRFSVGGVLGRWGLGLDAELARRLAALGPVAPCSRCVLVGEPFPEQGSLLEVRA